MDTRDLHIFLQLAKSLHFTRTSNACFISPSSLTRLVQRLEVELGAQLFERDNRTVKLTAAGQSFREYAQESLQNWEYFNRKLQNQSANLSGKISVFCSVTASYSFLQKLLDQFRKNYPEVEIQLHTGDTALTVQRILDGQEDIGIAARPDKLPAKLQFKLIGESPLVFIAPATDCPLKSRVQDCLAGNEPLPWPEIPMVLSETGLARSRADSWFRQQNIKPNIYAQVTGNEAIVSMVSLGFGVGVVPALVVENSPKQAKVTILDLAPELEPFSIGICSLRRKLKNPLIRTFWELSGETRPISESD
ncbi:MAG: HTH-type transcriptional activator IlvY [Gammaproteobacteria bacterium]|nr:HTH-type transcriptional activator IlvY [Gammaproteobacteria bacterium]